MPRSVAAARERHGAGSGLVAQRARCPGDGPLRRALGLLGVGAGAKLILVLLRMVDGAAAGLATPWAPPTLLYQEIWAAGRWLARHGGSGR